LRRQNASSIPVPEPYRRRPAGCRGGVSPPLPAPCDTRSLSHEPRTIEPRTPLAIVTIGPSRLDIRAIFTKPAIDYIDNLRRRYFLELAQPQGFPPVFPPPDHSEANA